MRVTRLISAVAACIAMGTATAGPAAAHDDGHIGHAHRTTLTERFCAHVFAKPEPDTALLQTLRRDDLTGASVVDVVIQPTVVLHHPFVVSCAFADSNGNGSRDTSERISTRVLRSRVDGVLKIAYLQRVVTDPFTSVCVLSIVLDGSARDRVFVGPTTCIVNPAADVPEASTVALLGLSALGTVVVVGWRRRRPVTT